MSELFQCGDNGTLVGYLYDECDAVERDAVAAHIAICAACAAELAALGSAREQLAAWTPPEAKLGFVITERQSAESLRLTSDTTPRRTPWFSRPLPVWAQVAAAALVFAVGLSLGIARGTSQTAVPPNMANVPARAGAAVASVAELTALERRLKDEIAAIRTANRDSSLPVAASSPSEAQLMARVRAMIEESEQRQQRELAIRTTQIVRDFESQRRVDLAQIQQNFGQIEGLTNAEVREQREMLNYLMRVSQQR
jgi:hypothetical protein